MSFNDWHPLLKKSWDEFLINKELISKDDCYLLFEKLNSEFQRITTQGNNDSLTGLISFKEWVKQIQKESNMDSASILMIDIDDFKLINDNYGHLEGNYQLKTLVHHLKNTWNQSGDLICRFGGDEFLVYASESIQKSYEKCLLLQEKLDFHTISVSIGIDKLNKVDELLKSVENADKAMYQSKFAGKKQIKLSGILKDGTILNFKSK